MKKVFFVSFLVVGISANAQHFSIGLKAGTNISNFTGTPSVELTNKALVGFYGGAYLNFWLGKNFTFQPEALISTQGAKFTEGSTSEKFNLTYVNVPVMFKYKTDGGFYVEAGPQVGFKLSESVPEDQTAEEFAENLDLSLGAGLGFQSAMGLGVGARYLAGISKVGDFDASDRPNFKNSVIQIGISYTLGGPKKK